MTTEIETLRDEILRLGVPAHAHVPGQSRTACPSDEVCVSEEELMSALIVSPSGGHEVHVDTMTAFGELCDLPDGAGPERVWGALAEIDRGA